MSAQKRGSTLPPTARGGVDKKGAPMPPGGGAGQGGVGRASTLPAAGRGGTVSSRGGITSTTAAGGAATAPARGGSVATRGGIATRGGTVPRGVTVPRGGTVGRGGGVTGTPTQSGEAGSEVEEVPSIPGQSETGLNRLDAAAVGQRTLGVPIAEVVRNHHERLALLEEKVYAPENQQDFAADLNADISKIKKKKRRFFKRKKTVKKEGGQPGETVEVEELVEMGPDGEQAEEELELELMESQITREEVLRMFSAQSATFKDLLREQRRTYDNALMTVMNELLVALEESEAGVNGERLNLLEERVAELEMELEKCKAEIEAGRGPSPGLLGRIPGIRHEKAGPEPVGETEGRGSQSGSVLGWFHAKREEEDHGAGLEEEPGFFSKIFTMEKREEETKHPRSKRQSKKTESPSVDYSEEISQQESDRSPPVPPGDVDYYGMESDPEVEVEVVAPVTRGRFHRNSGPGKPSAPREPSVTRGRAPREPSLPRGGRDPSLPREPPRGGRDRSMGRK